MSDTEKCRWGIELLAAKGFVRAGLAAPKRGMEFEVWMISQQLGSPFQRESHRSMISFVRVKWNERVESGPTMRLARWLQSWRSKSERPAKRGARPSQAHLEPPRASAAPSTCTGN